MRFDTDKEGLHTLFKPYQALLLEWIWELNEKNRIGVNSGQAYRYLQKSPEKKSRASVIFFLNDQVEEGVLTYEERTGKGGYQRVYYPKMNKEDFSVYVTRTIQSKLKEVFPNVEELETKLTT
ncbi:MAG: hypothetical protein JSV18_04325 [Candidatus Bathyarchaeota archaeon]|nr:MAG: hypothetical protein JSV18_04325 [Candidatus Bathyarchaeota archaeon]